MPDFKPNPLGILKCRDLTTLMYGVPMVAIAKQTDYLLEDEPTVVLVLPQDPRRIKYEIALGNPGASIAVALLSTGNEMSSNQVVAYDVPPRSTIIITRDWLADLDSVILPLWAENATGTVRIGVREILLTPAPVDEIPPSP